jgi:hypothetical protein
MFIYNMINTRFLYLVGIVVTISTVSCAKDMLAGKSVRLALYVDSLRGLSFNPIADDSLESNATFIDHSTGAILTITAADAQIGREDFRKWRRENFDARKAIVNVDSNLTIGGETAILWQYHCEVSNELNEMLQLDILSNNRIYSVMASCAVDAFAKNSEALRNSIFDIDFENYVSKSEHTTPGIVFVDSLRNFSFHPHFQGMSADSEEVVAMFYGPIDGASTQIMSKNVHTSRDQWHQQQKALLQKGMTLISDSNISVNNQEAILWKASIIFKGETSDVLSLSVIGRDKVYTIFSVCPRDQFPAYEAAIRESLLSFRLFPV